MAIYSGFTHSKWWFSIVTLVYQMVLWLVLHYSMIKYPLHPVNCTKKIIWTYINWLAFSTPLKNMKVSWGYYSQYMEKKSGSKPPTRSSSDHLDSSSSLLNGWTPLFINQPVAAPSLFDSSAKTCATFCISSWMPGRHVWKMRDLNDNNYD